MIKIRVFTAPDDQNASEKFIIGHKKLLEIYGITQITSNKQDWVEDANTTVIIVEDSLNGKVYGGARLQISTEQQFLPIETALSKYDKKIHDYIRIDRENGGTCELCGLWNSREVAGMGIGSHVLSRVGATIAAQLPVKSIFVLCAPSTVRMGKRVGAVVETELGNNGLFYYPKDDLVATAMRLRNIYDLSHAIETEAALIMALRENPYQKLKEKGPKGSFEIEYCLKVPILNETK